MTTVAVTRAAGPVGQALLERLDADPAITRIIGIDLVEPAMPVAKLTYRTADLRDRLLGLAVADADVVVHLGVTDDPDAAEDTAFVRNVHGTRNLLAAITEHGIPALVHLSDAMVYGAHPDNALPLDEQCPLRANPDFSPAYHHLLAEELVEELAQATDGPRVAVLRPAAALGPGVDHTVARHLAAPRLLLVAENEPPLQFVHIDDLAAALHLAVTGDLRGAYNVAADGWVAEDELCTVLGRRPARVPETVAFELTRRLWSRGFGTTPPGALHFLMHPCVVGTTKLKEAGWAPTRSNREALREFAAGHAGWLQVGRMRVRARDLAVTGFAVVGALLGLVLGGRAQRRAARRA
jgi:nucleoside-diphosphate-sugar epimerase